jgi:hypothetical protein
MCSRIEECAKPGDAGRTDSGTMTALVKSGHLSPPRNTDLPRNAITRLVTD